jgi:hypothetical protein
MSKFPNSCNSQRKQFPATADAIEKLNLSSAGLRMSMILDCICAEISRNNTERHIHAINIEKLERSKEFVEFAVLNAILDYDQSDGYVSKMNSLLMFPTESKENQIKREHKEQFSEPQELCDEQNFSVDQNWLEQIPGNLYTSFSPDANSISSIQETNQPTIYEQKLKKIEEDLDVAYFNYYNEPKLHPRFGEIRKQYFLTDVNAYDPRAFTSQLLDYWHQQIPKLKAEEFEELKAKLQHDYESLVDVDDDECCLIEPKIDVVDLTLEFDDDEPPNSFGKVA